MDISIIGGAGHVGLPLGLILADADHQVRLIDTDEARLSEISSGNVPFSEPGAQSLLNDALANGKITFEAEADLDSESDVIFLVVGTPIDKHHNPKMENLFEIVDWVSEDMRDGQTLILRSTVYPGTTSLVRDRLRDKGLQVGTDVFLGYAPERIAQHNAIEEIVGLPQLVGTFDDESQIRIEEVFKSFLEAECLRLTPTEAEIGKLFTNMWRYITFATANQFYLIADSFSNYHEVNIHRILERTSHEYPRFDVPSPGANVGGPCLTKDGWFLVDDFAGNELVSSAFQINEGMPVQLINRLASIQPDPSKVSILGMTYKRDSDDTRNSVSYKMRKKLKSRGIDTIVEVEPNLPGFDDWADVQASDWVVLMTPHSEFDDLDRIRAAVDSPDALFCDIWGHWHKMRFKSNNGFFRSREIPGPQTNEP